MNLNLSREMTAFVNDLITQGRFDSEDAAVAEGIRLLMQRETLRAEIQKGVQQLNVGNSFSEDEVFAEVNAVIDEAENLRSRN